MDFVFDRSADGQVIKSLAIVDDATHESVAIRPEHAISDLAVSEQDLHWPSSLPLEGMW